MPDHHDDMERRVLMAAIRSVSSFGRAGGRSEIIDTAARLGFAAKGVVYTLIGALALQSALGQGGDTEGSQGAVASIADEPFGVVILVMLAIGLAAYVLWRLATAILDTENAGSSAGGIAKRVGYFVSALSYGALTVLAVQLASGGMSSDGQSREEWTARLMSTEAGTWLLGLIGIAIVVTGLHQLYRGLGSTYMDRYNAEGMSASNRTWVKRAGRIGHAARGITFGIIGVLLIHAALQHDPSEAVGVGGALAALAAQPYGRWLLGVVAAGFVSYGIYCFFRVPYRRFEL
jgi:hypothetical protein